ncbi:MAG: ECF RNA polymerase sigma factor SigK [Actinomycetia bacterium]|nr:ECF RNA polymerase sigma factor SigK [Actinomycetes bacterium]
MRELPSDAPEESSPRRELDPLLLRVAKGDDGAFAELYDVVTPAVFGLARRVIRQAEQAEEVAQEVLLEVWQQAPRFDPGRGTGFAWVMMMTHRRAVDRVRSAQSSIDREARVGQRSLAREHDEVVEVVEGRLEAEAVRECIGTLTDLQRESVTLAYFGGLTYSEGATRLGTPLGTIKTRMRDGLIRLRDCLGVTA